MRCALLDFLSSVYLGLTTFYLSQLSSGADTLADDTTATEEGNMSWPYAILELTDAQELERRTTLDRYGLYAQFSGLFVIATLLSVRFAQQLFRGSFAKRVAYDAVPTASTDDRQRTASSSTFRAKRRRVSWWLGNDVVVAGFHLGRRDHFVYGSLWALWLLFLSIRETGRGSSRLVMRFLEPG